MLDSQILRRLAALNLSTEAFREVISIISDILEPVARNREAARIRKRNQRSRPVTVTGTDIPLPKKKDSMKSTLASRDCPMGQSRDSHSDTPPVDTSPPLSKKDTKESKQTLSMRACQLPPDFKLTEADIAFALSKGFDQKRVQSEFERFCDHAAAGGRRQVDWHAAWRKWVTSPYQNGNGGSNGRKYGTLDEQGRRLVELARSRERAAGIVRPDDFFRSSGGSDCDVEILPPERR